MLIVLFLKLNIIILSITKVGGDLYDQAKNKKQKHKTNTLNIIKAVHYLFHVSYIPSLLNIIFSKDWGNYIYKRNAFTQQGYIQFLQRYNKYIFFNCYKKKFEFH